MKAILTFLVALLPLCGFASPVEAEPLDVILSNSLSPGMHDVNYPMQYDGRDINVRVIWEVGNEGQIYQALGGVAGDYLFTAKDECTFDASGIVYLTVYLNDTKNKKKIVITGSVDANDLYSVHFEIIDHGSGVWPWPFE